MSANLRAAINYARNHPFREDVKTRLCAILIPVDSRGYNSSHWYVGYNQKKSHPLQAKYGRNAHSIFLHAEIDALVKAFRDNQDVEEARLFIARVLANGETAMAKPCKGCEKALLQYGIDEYWYTVGPGGAYKYSLR